MSTTYAQPIDSATSTVDPTWLLATIDAGVRYAQELWAFEMALPNAPVPSCDPIVDPDMRRDIRHLVLKFVDASRNSYTLSWSADSYNACLGGQDGHNAVFEAAMQELFVPLDNVIETRPSSIVDKFGTVVLYYVPGAIRYNPQADAFAGAIELNATFEKNCPVPDGTWRRLSRYYRGDTALLLTPGLATLGILHSTGHHHPGQKIHIAGDLGGSATHLTSSQRQAREWLPRNLRLGLLMSAAMAITHPEQYSLTRECLVLAASKSPEIEALLRTWPFAFTSLAAVSNRSTGEHRDLKSGDKTLYDVMATFGGDRDVSIQFKGLGFSGRYDSGSMAVIPCHTHLHSVSESPDAERIAFAAFSKPSLMINLGLDLPRPPTLELINALHIQQMNSRRAIS